MKLNFSIKQLFSGSNSNTFLRFVLIGSTLFSNKLVLILTAYFFSETQYNLFNKAYYTASILILFGTLGFDFAINRINISLRAVIIAVVLNVLITLVILYFLSEPFTSVFHYVSIFVYGLFACIGGIFTFQHLFHGRIKTYVVLMLISSFLHLLIIPFVTILKADIFFLFPFVSLVWFLIGYQGFVKHNTNESDNPASLYKIGISTFIINSAVSLALVADKYIVNHYFPVTTANAYTFSWGLIVPLFYLGTVVEKLIYGSTSSDSINVFRKSMFILLLLVSFYSITLLAAVNYLPSLIPNSVDSLKLIQILGFMITGYAVFVVLNFPINGYLFKFAETTKQKTIALAYLALLISFPIIYILINGGTKITEFRTLLTLIWVFIFLLLIIKSTITFFDSRKSVAL